MEADFQSAYGVDLDDPHYRAKSMRWFKVRLHGLLTDPDTRLFRVFMTPDSDDDSDEGASTDGE